MNRVAHWSREHPFLVALVVLLAIVVPGMIRLEMTATAAHRAADAAAANAARNTVVVNCLIGWVHDHTEALNDRDVLVIEDRKAKTRLWIEVREFLTADPPSPTINPLVSAIETYLDVIERLQANVRLNPYPDIEPCLTEEQVQ